MNRGLQEDFKRDGMFSQIIKRISDLEAFEREFRLKQFGGAAGLTMIDDQVLAASAASFSFVGIPATYKHLKIEFSARSDRAAGSDAVKIAYNGDAGNNYVGLIQWGAGQNEQAAAGAPFTFTFISAATSPANWFNNSEITIFDYANTVTYKSYQARGMQTVTNVAGNFYIYDGMGIWLSLAAINEISIYPNIGPNFVAGSRATLYGIS